MIQLLFGDSSTSVGANLVEAIALLEQRLAVWASNSDAYNALLLEVFGEQPSAESEALQASISGAGLGIIVEILQATTMDGLMAAYTSDAPGGGGERIYLNADWLESATAAEIEAVLLEELGHAIDISLNGSVDTDGDEGAIFSALLRDVTPAPAAYSENDQSVISIAGNSVPVEAAAIATEYIFFEDRWDSWQFNCQRL